LKNTLTKYGYIILLIATIYGAFIFSVLPLAEEKQPNDEKLISLELIEVTEDAFYFYDASAEAEPRIYVGIEDVAKWELDQLPIGAKVTGVFDATGWELRGVRH
jgi:hypothetical protein